jgi:probable addiction module antidote protein
MTKKIKISELPDFDPAEYMKDDDDIAAYLALVIEDDNPAEFIHALGIAARAKGMMEIARTAGLSREALYQALYPTAPARGETGAVIAKVCQALSLRPMAHAA